MSGIDQYLIDSSYYGAEDGELYTAREPIPGYRLEQVTPAGKIGYYDTGGYTPIAGCASYRYPHQSILRNLLPPVPALHDPCCTCGHRIMRSLGELASFVASAAESQGWQNLFLNRAYHGAAAPKVAIVECLVPDGAVVTARQVSDAPGSLGDVPGTLRTDRLQLGRTVWLPRQGTRTEQRATAKSIRERYPDVRVRQPDTDALGFINTLTPAGEPGDHGTAGVLFTSGTPRDPLYLLSKDGERWDIPTAKRLSTESALSAAIRAATDAGLDLGASSVAGAVGDKFAVFLAYLEEPPQREGMQWFTRKELWTHVANGAVAPQVIVKLQSLERLRHLWNDALPKTTGRMNTWKL